MNARPSPLGRRSALAGVVGVFLALGLSACSKPKPPTVVPKEATVVAIDTDAITLDLRVEMTNPNAFAINVQRFAGRVKVDTVDLGGVDVPHAVSLPPNAPTLVQVPFKVRWQGAAGLATIAGKGRDVPFTVNGTVGIGAEKFSFDVPFTQTGVITQQQLKDAAIRSIEKQLQGLPGLNIPR